jgi:hypothetical protein
MVCQSPTYWFDRPNNNSLFGEDYRSCSSSLCSHLQSPVTSPMLEQNVFLSSLFLNTLRLEFSVNVNFALIWNNKQNYSSIYILIFIFFDSKLEDKILHRRVGKNPWLQFSIKFLVKAILIFRLLSKNLNFTVLSNELLPVFVFWFCSAFCLRGTSTHSGFSNLTSRSISLLATDGY